jgi:ATP-dependent RNA helicase DeaD
MAKRYQRNAIRVATMSDKKQHLDIEYRALTVAPNDRENAIVNVLRYFEAKNALVFCATRATVNHMTSRFNNRGLSVVALSGELSQNERTHALQAMRDGRARVCVATDVAARGIDLPNLELVIHADIPKSRETLLHRSGRTGRAGRKGVCALIVPHNWRKRTERLLGNANIEATWAKPPSAEEVMVRDHERLLSDPSLSEPLSDIEKNFAEEILTRHSPEQVAAAFVRKHFADQAAPEELLDAGPSERPQKQREDFKDGVWISLSVGREHNAEPRWLLPMLCRAGHITKHEIGAIRIQPRETYVELAPQCVDKFLEALGPSAKMEKTISVTRLKDAPAMPRKSQRDGPDRARGKKKISYTSDKPDAHGKKKPKRTFSRKPDETSEAKKPGDKKPWEKKSGEKKSGEKKPWEKKSKKPKDKTKKKHKSKFAGKAEKGGGQDLSGSAPLKRKKPKKPRT